MKKIPGTVFALGLVSFFSDFASEMIYPLLPLFLATVLGAGTAALGLIEGVAESTASLLKVFSGIWTDRTRRRKPLIVGGYSLAGLVRPLIGLTTGWPSVLILRFIDRVGKGLRTSPRDALIADVTEGPQRATAYGFHRAMDHAGSIVGPLVAAALMGFGGLHLRQVFFLAALPAIVSVAISLFAIREPAVRGPAVREPIVQESFRLTQGWKQLSANFKYLLVSLLIFTLGNSTDAFLIVRLTKAGVAVQGIALLWSLHHLIKMLATYFGGKLSDHIGHRTMILLGWIYFALIYYAFSRWESPHTLIAIFLAYGIYFGLAEPAERALVADLVPAHLRGTAFGFYHLTIGLGMLPASLLFGFIWQQWGVTPAFLTGSGLALLASLLLWGRIVRDQGGVVRRPIGISLILVMFALAACSGGSTSGSGNEDSGGDGGDDSGEATGLPDSLSSCTNDSVFTVLPMADADIWYVAPLGNLNPTGHTFPTDHIYLYIVREESDPSIPKSVNVYAPGRIWIGQVSASEHLSADPSYTDYSISFYPCRELLAKFGHIQTLTADIESQIGAFDEEDCETYTTGGEDYRACTKSVEIEVTAGTLLGTAGREGQYALDMWLYDGRIEALAYANPGRLWTADTNLDPLHIVCPVDYFDATSKTTLEAKLGSASTDRTVEPICGEVMQDVAGTAQGKWYSPSTSETGEDPHLALVHDNFDPTQGAFSVGTSVPTISDRVLSFTPAGSGLVNRDFSEVTADGNIYCYDSLDGAPASTIVLVQLTSATALKIESRSAASCGSGPWAFTASVVSFER